MLSREPGRDGAADLEEDQHHDERVERCHADQRGLLDPDPLQLMLAHLQEADLDGTELGAYDRQAAGDVGR